jgi:hypothetical protein
MHEAVLVTNGIARPQLTIADFNAATEVSWS